MQSKKQLCRYYQRGTCQYGARCKFSHETQQPSKPTNAFGFGSQQPPTSLQQHNNPFGFGRQTSLNSQSQQSRPAQQQQPNPFGFGVKANDASSKPFENKWSRFSANPGSTTTSASSRQADGQPPSATHSYVATQKISRVCTDPDTCKRQIAEDFQHERPLWKLTCYGHHKCAPCDIIGDTSYEELRLSAYNDAKSGMSLISIAEKERQLINAKLVEFESLLRNPYKGPAISVTNQSPFPQATPNAFSPIVNNVASPSTWTFGQPASSLNIGSGVNATASSPNKPAGIFQHSGTSPSVFETPNSPLGGLSSHSAQAVASPFGANKPSLPSSFMSTPSSTIPHSFPNSTIGNSAIQAGATPASQETVLAVETGFINKPNLSDLSVDDKIWLKEKWHPGEIPETPPPERFIF